MSRSSSSDSSALSHISVRQPTPKEAPAPPPAATNTPPTSISDAQSRDASSGRAKRTRKVSTYNLKELSDAQQSTRNVSGLTGRTLVDDEEDAALGATDDADKNIKDMDWEEAADLAVERELPPRPARRPSVKDRIKNATKKAGSALGKRSRDMVEAGKKKLGIGASQASPKQSRALKQLDMGKRGVLDELDLDTEYAAPPPRPAKKLKLDAKAAAKEEAQPLITGPMQKTSDGKRVKKWQTQGLYAGQTEDPSSIQPAQPKKLQKKQPGTATFEKASEIPEEISSEDSDAAEMKTGKRPFMPLPMFGRLDYDRDFTIPYDVFAPASNKDDKPKDWRQLNRNRLIGEAKDLWEKQERLPASACVCPVPMPGELGCEDDCLNRVMQYECNEDNCTLSAKQCSNRAFTELADRTKKGGKYDIGVEVVKTDQRGHGVRASRSFLPGQIIMEYTGEIISEAECQRRMREDYKDKPHYYLMELERNLVIDGTKGSMARFINHSCEPNCEVRMVKVQGIPRMGVFAGNIGIMTGEELTYDYNFDSFGETKQTCYCGTPSCRGTLSKRLNAAEQKKYAKEEQERKRKAAAEIQKLAEEEARRKKVKTDRGSSWRGWVSVDDEGVKEKLKQEKRLKEEAESGSSRALRAAARRGEIIKPVVPARQSSLRGSRGANGTTRKASTGRRKTMPMDSIATVLDSAKSGDAAQAAEDKSVERAAEKSSAGRRKTTALTEIKTSFESERDEAVANATEHTQKQDSPGGKKAATSDKVDSVAEPEKYDTMLEDESEDAELQVPETPSSRGAETIAVTVTPKQETAAAPDAKKPSPSGENATALTRARPAQSKELKKPSPKTIVDVAETATEKASPPRKRTAAAMESLPAAEPEEAKEAKKVMKSNNVNSVERVVKKPSPRHKQVSTLKESETVEPVKAKKPSTADTEDSDEDEDDDIPEPELKPYRPRKRLRTTSTGSRFHENLANSQPRSSSSVRSTSGEKKVRKTLTKTKITSKVTNSTLEDASIAARPTTAGAEREDSLAPAKKSVSVVQETTTVSANGEGELMNVNEVLMSEAKQRKTGSQLLANMGSKLKQTTLSFGKK